MPAPLRADLLSLAAAVRAAEARNWKNLTLLYLSDVKGKIEPCG